MKPAPKYGAARPPSLISPLAGPEFRILKGRKPSVVLQCRRSSKPLAARAQNCSVPKSIRRRTSVLSTAERVRHGSSGLRSHRCRVGGACRWVAG
jgi:hypothetical protein